VVRDLLDLPGYRYLVTLEDEEDHVLHLAEVVNHRKSCPHPQCLAKGRLEGHGSYPTEFDDWDHGKRRMIRVMVPRWLCLACRDTCSDDLPNLDLAFKATRRLTESIEHQIDYRKSYSLIAVETHLSLATIRRIAIRLRETRQTINSTTAPVEGGFDGKMFLGVYRFVATKTKERVKWDLLEDTTQKKIEKFFEGITNREALMRANLDFALDIIALVKKWFPNAVPVIDPYHVMNLLCKRLAKVRVEEGHRLVKRAVENLRARTDLPNDPAEKAALERKIRRVANKQSRRLKGDSGLFNAPLWELGRADQLKVRTWLGAMPLLREAHGLLQNMHRLYRHKTSPETAAAMMNRWFDRLSPGVMRFVGLFVRRVRKHMRYVCASWPTGSNNGYTEAVNDTLEDIQRTRGQIGFDGGRDIFLYSESPTSILQRRRVKRQEERAPGEEHASVRPRRKSRGDVERAPKLRKRKRQRSRPKGPKRSTSPDQLGLSPELCSEIAEKSA
jgi:transposase